MKTIFKRASKSTLAVVLALCMLVSCMTVGIIATDAAKISGNSEAVGAQTDSESVGAFGSGSTLIVKTGQLGTDDSKKYYAYFFGGSITSGNEVWVELTKITAGAWNGKYFCTVPAGSPGKVIITKNNSNGSGWNNKESQSVDITLSGNYAWVADSGQTDGKANGGCTSKEFKVLVKNGNTETSYDLTEDNGLGVFSVTTPAITTAATRLEVKNYNSSDNQWYGNDGQNYWLNDCVVGNSYTVTASVDIKNVSTSNWTGSTFNKTLVSSNSSYSLTGDIWSSCITEINSSTNTITRDEPDDGVWWGSYHSDAAIGNSTGNAGEYYIDITTADRATFLEGNPTFTTIDIGLYNNSANKQQAFKIGDTYYNEIGKDYKVTSAGVSNADIVDLAVSNGGGSLQLQPGRTYRITVNETTSKISVQCTSGDKYFLAGQYSSDGTPYFFGTVWTTSNNELTETSSGSGVYEKTFTSDIPAGTINFKVVKNGDSDGWDGGSWPAENQSYVIRENATSVTFTFNSNTHTTTVTQTNSGGGGASGDWIAGDKYTSTGTNSNQHVDDTPNIGTTSSTYKYVWADTDNGPGKSNTTAISLVQNASSGNIGYWAEVSDQTLSGSNFFFALSTNNNNSGIRGNKEETINCVVPSSGSTSSSGDAVNIYNSNHEQVFQVGRQERSDVSGGAYFIKIVGVNTSKVAAIGVMAYYNGSGKVDYQIYFKEKGATPVVETKVVDIYAKDACLRDDTFNRFARLATTTIDSLDAACFEYTDEDGVTYSSISAYNDAKNPDIVITRESYGGTDAGYTKMTNVPVGAKVKIKTSLSSNASAQGSFDNKAFKETHYVKGYSVNGMTYQINEWESDGVYEEIWTVRAVNTTYKDSNGVLQDATTGGRVVEVTPIYYMKDNTNCKTFYIDGYDGTVQNAWGNMLCVYPYYEGKSNKDNAFGGYPGQPMLLWGGKYQMEIPLTVDGTASGASVKGLTLHNGFWDLLHRSIDIRCNARNHAQTYDYDDFYKLYKEKNPDTIIFDFKYRTANDNFGDGYNYFNYEFAGTSGSEQTKDAAHYAASGKNGVEIITDYFGRQVDVFGNLLTDAQKSDYDSSHPQDKELLIVSTGYKDTYVGEYATLWAVYAPQSSIPSGSNDTAGKFIGLISSSELYLNTWDNASKYPVSDHGLLMTDSRFENTYKHLKEYYTGVPALITYDREIWNDSKDKANRSDGKWYYSNKSDKISASIKIQYGAYSLYEAPDHSVSSDAWNDDPFNQSKTGVGGYNNIGTNTGCSAYFTNTTPNLNGKVASGEQFADSTKKFTFQAVPSGSYMFAGWVRYSNGKYYKITENEIGESPMSSNDVYIARFVTAKTGTLTVQHVVEQTNEYNGTGTPSVTVHVKNGDTDVTGSPYTVSDGSKIDISKWIDARNATYTIDISLTTTPNNESYMKEIVSSSGNFAATPASWTGESQTSATNATVAQFTVQEILDSGVTSLRYVSHLQKPTYTYQYEITYTYQSRFWGEQSYTQTGTCEEGDFTGSKTSAVLNTDFIIHKTPYEKSFRQQINWNYTNSVVAKASGDNDHGAAAMVNNAATAVAGQDNTYKMTAHVYASNTVNDKVTAEFVLPYKYNAKSQGYTAKDTDVYTAADGSISGTSYLYDTGNESVTLTTSAYKLFTYDDLPHTGSDDTLASGLPLMEAAPYVWMNVDYHTKPANTKRYYTGNSFTAKNANGVNITYYLREKPDGTAAGANEVIITDADVRNGNYTVTFTKRSNMSAYGGDDHTTTYKYAVAEGTPGTVGYKVYLFAYNMNASEQMTTNDGTVITDEQFEEGADPVFNGQYIVYTETEEKDGIIANTGVQKFFTRWDIFNTKGDFVASCFNRRFSYSGYDNYVVRPVYDSDTENSYASSLGDGYKSTITYLDDSRNQWKGTGASGTYATTTGQTNLYAADKLFTDFAITYNYNGQNINKVKNLTQDSANGANIRVGMVIERLGRLDNVGTSKITSASYYADKYKGDTNWQNLAGRLAGTESGTLTEAVTSGHMCYNSKIGANYAVDGYTLFNSAAPGAVSGQTSVIDNFNRLQWFYTINNSTQRTSEEATATVTEMKNYAYRAISYIIVTDSTGTHATLTDTPAYFTIYDTATRTGN